MPAKPRRSGLRLAFGTLLAIVLLAAAGHAVLWLWLCGRLEAGLTEWAAARRVEGWRVEHGPPRRGGWPFTASLTVPEVRLRGGGGWLTGGVDWWAEAVTLRVSPPDLQRLTVDAPGRHRLRVGEAAVLPFTAGRLQAALPLGAGAATATARRLRFGSGAGAVEVGAVSLDYGARPGGAGAGTALRATALDVALPPDMPGADRLGRTVDRIGLDLVQTGAVPAGGAPAQRAAAWRDGGGALDVRSLEARWGEVAAATVATLILDSALQPAGTGVLRLTGGEAALEAAGSAGLLSPLNAVAARFALGAVSRAPAEGGPPRAELPLALRDRTVRLGPVSLGRLPALEWSAGQFGGAAR